MLQLDLNVIITLFVARTKFSSIHRNIIMANLLLKEEKVSLAVDK